ncbi:MAG: hypothetical protein UY98_C0024G0003 [Candidatus Kaiserbacteria bacterium GW2011_GWA2_58_9]|uniref:Uncharacterized protein n=1 Tax=Candidatus Kaiserbacteria bacterium GW2011_GWA2_58_9 TaxID=1618672 RepID=A0A0G1YU38_9BACT|nr:MAG: hypothetical protein UY98_C0024G0003 [Candidatus Kaiserbacteria bacterium GW2011_GWA2_58_9]
MLKITLVSKKLGVVWMYLHLRNYLSHHNKPPP